MSNIDVMTDAEYSNLIDELVYEAITKIQNDHALSHGDADALESEVGDIKEHIVHAVYFTSHDAFDGMSFASFEKEASNAYLGSIIDHAERPVVREKFDTLSPFNAGHIGRLAANYLYSDVRAEVFAALRREYSED